MRSLILAVALLAGCSTTTIPLVVELPLPEPLKLPSIQGAELMCLSDEVYKTLIKGIIRPLKERVQTLRDIIETTHE